MANNRQPVVLVDGSDHDILLAVAIQVNRLYVDMQDLKERVYGNGQPGDMDRIKDRVGKLENRYWKAVGIVAGVCGVGVALSTVASLLVALWVH